ncbi:50S ribosomal protein L15 [Candidatus Peregrinibacteria bacterium]|nr:MAG: 50S ribosomal protein L15 [Candidatus Peregrinibacteria bacterium]
MKQHTLKPTPGSTKSKLRRGRGLSRGNYSGRGMKGQNSRSGGGVRPGFEGGQTPLIRRMPKLKGFLNPNKVTYMPINLADLNVFKDGEKVDAKVLHAKKLIKALGKVKLLGNGELTVKVKLTVNRASATALEKAEKAGAEVTVLEKTAE